MYMCVFTCMNVYISIFLYLWRHYEIGWDGMDWIDLAQVTGHWRAVASKVINHGVP
jgi:hypothetical protein